VPRRHRRGLQQFVFIVDVGARVIDAGGIRDGIIVSVRKQQLECQRQRHRERGLRLVA
jgi:hypothetical protein